MTDKPDAGHMGWAIDQRAKIQHTLLALHVYVRKAPPDHVASYNELVLDALIAAAFSLWRAVFLADHPGSDISRRRAMEEFLASVISTNAITFADDRRNNAWSVRYYMSTASDRIWSAAALLNNRSGSNVTKDITSMITYSVEHDVCATRQQWEGMHAALRGLFNLLEPESTLVVERPSEG